MSYKVKFFIGGQYKQIIKEMDENNLDEYWEKLHKANPDASADFREFDTYEEKLAFLDGLEVSDGWDKIVVV